MGYKMLLINCSNREENCYKILNDIMSSNDKIISLSNKKMDFCLGCERCIEKLDKHCILDDYITNNVLGEIVKEDSIILASPLYISNINGILKNLIDRLNCLYHHDLLKGKRIYLILTGYASSSDNEEEINGIINYFEGISSWLYFDFELLDYFSVSEKDPNYDIKINKIKEKLNKEIVGVM